ncbi:MAG TPA: DUF6326 family protein [Flavihumibacter sp.]|jgi:hypothetical protein
MRQKKELIDFNPGLKLKLASLWVSLMFLVIYIDYFHLYMPGSLSDLQRGKVFVFDISQGFLLAALAAVLIPALMICISVLLPARANRLANIIAGALNIPLMLFNLAGEAWIHMVVGAAIEVTLLGLIIYYAWNWPRFM